MKVGKKGKYKTSLGTRIIIEVLGWLFLIGIPLGIWWNEFRWKLIFTALFALFIAFMLIIVDKSKEGKSKENEH